MRKLREFFEKFKREPKPKYKPDPEELGPTRWTIFKTRLYDKYWFVRLVVAWWRLDLVHVMVIRDGRGFSEYKAPGSILKAEFPNALPHTHQDAGPNWILAVIGAIITLVVYVVGLAFGLGFIEGYVALFLRLGGLAMVPAVILGGGLGWYVLAFRLHKRPLWILRLTEEGELKAESFRTLRRKVAMSPQRVYQLLKQELFSEHLPKVKNPMKPLLLSGVFGTLIATLLILGVMVTSQSDSGEVTYQETIEAEAERTKFDQGEQNE